MKNAKLMTNLLICFQLLTAQFFTTAHALAEDFPKTKEECEKKSSTQWYQGRCVWSDDVVKSKANSNNCKGLTGDDYRKCFAENAKKDIKAAEADGLKADKRDFKKNEALRYGIPLTISLVTAYYLFLNKDKLKGCKSTSLWLLMGGGLAQFLGELSANITYSTRLKKALKEYQAKSSETEGNSDITQTDKATNMHMIALDYMIKQEKARKAAETVRYTSHTLATALYAGCVIAAIAETAQVGWNMGASCPVKTQTSYTPFNQASDEGISVADLMEASPTDRTFSSFHYIKNLSPEELVEIITRKVISELGIPAAYAQDNSDLPSEENRIMNKEENYFVDKNTGDTYKLVNGKWEKGDPIADGETFTKADGTQFVASYGPDGKFNPSGAPNANTNNPPAGSNDKTSNLLNAGNIGGLVNTGSSVLKNSGSKTFLDGVRNAANTTGPQLKTKFDQAVATPWIRGAFAIALGTYSGIIAVNAKKSADIADDRIKAIEQIKADYEESGGASFLICKNGRDNSSDPACYCYNNDGKLDESRKNHAACKNADPYKYISATDYNKNHNYGYQPLSVCLPNKEGDTNCERCKKNPDQCKILSIGRGSVGLGGMSWANGLYAGANDLFTGNLDSSNLEIGSLQKKAMALKNKLKEMDKNPKYKGTIDKMQNFSDALKKAAPSIYQKSLGNNGSSPLLASSSLGASSGTPLTKNNILEEAKKDIASIDAKFTSGGNAGQKSSSASDDFDLDFGASGESGIKIEDDLAQVMNKDFQYKGDIHKNANNNIFKILSNRYQRSGLRRLFDSKGISQADSAANTDINEQ